MTDATALDPRMRVVWTIVDAAVCFVVVAVVLAADLAAWAELGTPPLVFAGPVALAAAAHVWWWPRAAYRAWQYRLGEDNLELRHGVVFRTLSVIPYGRVQHVDTTQGPVDRLVGLSRLVVHTAAASTDKVIPGVSDAAAAELRTTLLARAGVDDV